LQEKHLPLPAAIEKAKATSRISICLVFFHEFKGSESSRRLTKSFDFTSRFFPGDESQKFGFLLKLSQATLCSSHRRLHAHGISKHRACKAPRYRIISSGIVCHFEPFLEPPSFLPFQVVFEPIPVDFSVALAFNAQLVLQRRGESVRSIDA
jgi:hypothetical protein